MTKEEAVRILNTMLFASRMSNITPIGTQDEVEEAVLMAIEALFAEPCEDAISRKSVIDVLTKNRVHFCDVIKITSELKELPSVTPKQKIGYWVFPNSATKMICTCSCCGGDGTAFGKDKFCRNCGAKMIEKDDTDDEIKVGDEVISIFGDRGYVTQNDGDELCVLYPSGAVGHSSISTYKKTGKHFSQITEVLEQMKG